MNNAIIENNNGKIYFEENALRQIVGIIASES